MNCRWIKHKRKTIIKHIRWACIVYIVIFSGSRIIPNSTNAHTCPPHEHERTNAQTHSCMHTITQTIPNTHVWPLNVYPTKAYKLPLFPCTRNWIYPHCLVLVGSRNKFEYDFTIELILRLWIGITIEKTCY